jgi:hypothetical protein
MLRSGLCPFLCALAVAPLFFGCVHTRTVSPDTSPEALDGINQVIEGRPGSITLNNRDTYHGSFHVAFDSTVFFQGLAAERRVFPNADIRRIMIPDFPKGRIEGLGYGALTGGLIGTVLGALLYGISNDPVYSPPPYDSTGYVDLSSHHHRSILRYLAVGAGIGAIPGATIGLAIGNQTGSLLKIRFQTMRLR